MFFIVFQRVEGSDRVLFNVEVQCFKMRGKEFADSMFAVGDGRDFNKLAMETVDIGSIECSKALI